MSRPGRNRRGEFFSVTFCVILKARDWVVSMVYFVKSTCTCLLPMSRISRRANQPKHASYAFSAVKGRGLRSYK